MLKSNQGSGKIRLVAGLTLLLVSAGGIDASPDSLLWIPLSMAAVGLSLMFWSVNANNRGQ